MEHTDTPSMLHTPEHSPECRISYCEYCSTDSRNTASTGSVSCTDCRSTSSTGSIRPKYCEYRQYRPYRTPTNKYMKYWQYPQHKQYRTLTYCQYSQLYPQCFPPGGNFSNFHSLAPGSICCLCLPLKNADEIVENRNGAQCTDAPC